MISGTSYTIADNIIRTRLVCVLFLYTLFLFHTHMQTHKHSFPLSHFPTLTPVAARVHGPDQLAVTFPRQKILKSRKVDWEDYNFLFCS